MRKDLTLKYLVIDEDLASLKSIRTCLSPILQLKWLRDSPFHLEEQRRKIAKSLEKFLTANKEALLLMDFEARNIRIYQEVFKLEIEYPDLFPAFGYYSKQLLINAYLEGKVSFENFTYQDYIDITEKEKNILLEEKRILALKEQEKKELALIAMNKIELARIPIKEGMVFRNLTGLINTLCGVAKIPKNQTKAKQQLDEYVDILKLPQQGRHTPWRVTNVKKEGLRVYLEDLIS